MLWFPIQKQVPVPPGDEKLFSVYIARIAYLARAVRIVDLKES